MKYEQFVSSKKSEEIKVKSEALSPDFLPRVLDEELGIGIHKTRMIMARLYDAIEQALESHKLIRLGKNIKLEPILHTEEVQTISGFRDIMRVYPERGGYKLALSKTLDEKLFGKHEHKYALRGTRKFIDWKDAHPDALGKSRYHTWKAFKGDK